MDSVLRATAVYAFMLLIFRVAGKRSLAQTTTFDFVLLMIVGEATQQALLGDDYSLTNSFVIVLTLVALDGGLSLFQQRSAAFDRWVDDVPLVIVDNGRPLADRLAKVRLNESDILAAARQLQGLERMDQIKYAVLERSGDISIIPKASA